jgi:hypothetical protein
VTRPLGYEFVLRSVSMVRPVVYPFEPKSTRSLTPGDYWAVPLTDGGFACGRVLQLEGDHLPTPSRTFFGGLHDWLGEAAPTSDDIAGALFVDFGVMHIRTIVHTGGQVLGNRPLEADAIELPLMLDAHAGPRTRLVRGAQTVRVARREEWGTRAVLGVWGYGVTKVRAEKMARDRKALR